MSPQKLDPARNTATYMALVGLLVVACGLMFLAILVIPNFAFLGLVVFALFFFGAFHYVVWGWWLGRPSAAHVEDTDPSAPHLD